MAEVKNYTVEEVNILFAEIVVETFAATPEGQAHLNRIAKAITNESLDKRLASQRDTLAEAAFNKALATVAAKNAEDVPAFLTGKAAWKEKYIARKYGTSEE